MPSNTERLKLYKVDPETDGHMTFNIEKMLNENWDKIDTAFKNLSDEIVNIDAPVKSVNNKTGDVVLNAEDVGAPTVQQHNELSQQVSAHLAEHLRIEIGVAPPENPNSKTFWLEDLGESIDFVSGSGLLIGNASTDGSEDVWFDENI